MDLLILLVERHRQLVWRADIVKRLWLPGVFVDVDMGVNTAIRKLRQALLDSKESPSFIETISGKGYRFHRSCHHPCGRHRSIFGSACIPHDARRFAF